MFHTLPHPSNFGSGAPVHSQHHRLDAVRAHLQERAGQREEALASYLRAARRTTSTAERNHLTKRAARLRSA